MNDASIDNAVRDLVRVLKRVRNSDLLLDVDVYRLEQWLEKYQHPLRYSAIVALCGFVRRVIAHRCVDEEAWGTLTLIQENLSSKRRHRGIGVALARVLADACRLRAKMAEAAYHDEIIRLIESGAKVTMDSMTPRVMSMYLGGRVVKALIVDGLHEAVEDSSFDTAASRPAH